MPDDRLIVISQVWSRQLHPDPTGTRTNELMQLVKSCCAKIRSPGRQLILMDLLSMPQRPFLNMHGPWSEEDRVNTSIINEALPWLIYHADAVVCLSRITEQVIENEGARYSIPEHSLRSQCLLRQVGKVVQVAELQPEADEVQCFDQVISHGRQCVQYLEDLPGDVPGCQSLCQTGFHGFLSTWMFRNSTVELLRTPFGYTVATPWNEQGRMCLEHIICIIKLALTENAEPHDHVFCDDKGVMDFLVNSSRRLASAIAGGVESLGQELEQFGEILKSMVFTPPWCTPPGTDSLGTIQHKATLEEPSEHDVLTDAMGAFLDKLAISVSSQLLKAARGGDVSACKRLLQESGDVNFADGSGRTCLHYASQMRSVDVVQLLLESKASCFAKDRNFYTPAHCVPLFADAITTELVRKFSAIPHLFSEVSADGVSVFERFYCWSLVALRGKPYTQVIEILDAMPQDLMAMQSRARDAMQDRPENMFESARAHVRVTKRSLAINGLLRFIYCVEPKEGNERPCQECEAVLYLGFCRLLPWSLQEPAIHYLVAKTGVPFFCIGCEALNPDLLAEEDAGDLFYKDLFAVIDALPIHGRFVLFDSTFGLGMPVLWKLQQRLAGILIVNASWLFKQSSEETSLHQRLAARAAKLGSLAQSRDIDAMVEMLPDFALFPAFLKMAQGTLEFVKQDYAHALQTASSRFWRMSALQPEWNFNHLSRKLNSMPVWPSDFAHDIIVACGSHAPAAAVHDSTASISNMLPVCEVSHIPNSMWFWQLESPQSADAIVESLGQILRGRSTG